MHTSWRQKLFYWLLRNFEKFCDCSLDMVAKFCELWCNLYVLLSLWWLSVGVQSTLSNCSQSFASVLLVCTTANWSSACNFYLHDANTIIVIGSLPFNGTGKQFILLLKFLKVYIDHIIDISIQCVFALNISLCAEHPQSDSRRWAHACLIAHRTMHSYMDA